MAGDPGRTLVAADYSQIELRILAHVSGDEHLREAFARGADIHRETAALVLHKDPADVTAGRALDGQDGQLRDRLRDERLRPLHAGPGIPRGEAQAFIDRYFATYSGISYYMLHIKETARRDGLRHDAPRAAGARSPSCGRRNPRCAAAGERMAINMPIQGTAADIMKIAMIRVARRLRAEGFRSRLLLQVHDELLLEVPARRGRPARAGPPRDDGGGPGPRRAADGGREGRRRLGVDDARPAPRPCCARRARRPGLPDRPPMPELPEVETVARDLRRLVVGATITGADGDWPRAIRSHPTVAAFAAAVAGRTIDGRRPAGEARSSWSCRAAPRSRST